MSFLLTFCKSKKIVILLTLDKSKKIVILLTLGKSLRWSLIFNLNKTPLGETGCLSNPYFLLTGCSGIQFFDSPPFPTQSVRPPLVTYPSLCSTCVTYKTLCHAIGHQVLPTQPLPREVEDFPRGDKRFKYVPPPTYLIYFSPKGVYVVGSIYVLRPLHGTLINPSLVLNQHFKSPIC